MYHIFIAGFKPSTQKAEECLQKVRDLQKEGRWGLSSVSAVRCEGSHNGCMHRYRAEMIS